MSDIPEDVLELAEEAYLQAIYMTTSDNPKNMVQMVALSIMAERERIAANFARRPNDVWTGEAVASTIRHPS